MEATKNTDVTNLLYFFNYLSSDDEEKLSVEEIEKNSIELEKTISKKMCEDKNINISLIALNELEKIGFKKDLPAFVFSKLIEDLYHERKAYSSSDYFDLNKPGNKHYLELIDYFRVGNEQLYKGIIAKSIGESESESKNINDIAYGIVHKISNNLEINQKLKLEA